MDSLHNVFSTVNACRYLLQIRLTQECTVDKLFCTYNAMKQYIMEREFYFIHADYTTYDLAIQLKD